VDKARQTDLTPRKWLPTACSDFRAEPVLAWWSKEILRSGDNQQRHQTILLTSTGPAIDDLSSVTDDSAMTTAPCDPKKTKMRLGFHIARSP
jgi:hypothetical protein